MKVLSSVKKIQNKIHWSHCTCIYAWRFGFNWCRCVAYKDTGIRAAVYSRPTFGQCIATYAKLRCSGSKDSNL